MKLGCLVTLVVVAMLMNDVEASWWRSCRFMCWYSGGRIYCGIRCGFRRKREAVQPFPASFEAYDLDGNNYITIDEFASALKVKVTDRGTKLAFEIADRDGDGLIDREEFEIAPYQIDGDDDEYKKKLFGTGNDDNDDENQDEAGQDQDEAGENQDEAGENPEEFGDQEPVGDDGDAGGETTEVIPPS